MTQKTVTLFLVFICCQSHGFSPVGALSKRLRVGGDVTTSFPSLKNPSIPQPFLKNTTTTAILSSSNSVFTRKLGSQELLMLPRQYSPYLNTNRDPFPPMNHVCAVLLSPTPSVSALQNAIDEAMATHPLLRCYVKGNGEPEKRVDLFQMVRSGDPDPCTFVVPSMVLGDNSSDHPTRDKHFNHNDVLTVVDVLGGPDDHRISLRKSWELSFRSGLDDGSWCNVTTGPLWKLEFHRLSKQDDKNLPCAFVFSFNHAISDQTSVNMLIDQILSDISSIQEHGAVLNKAVRQSLPLAMEDSILGINNRWSDIQAKGVSVDTLRYVAGKATEGFRNPVILPDDRDIEGENDKGNLASGNSVLSALTTITGKSPGGESAESKIRQSALTFRKLSKGTTDSLVAQCRLRGVTMSHALSASIALTASDFIDGGRTNTSSGMQRNYKVLHSLDMRRFATSDALYNTVRCMASSHDLIFGPLSDNSGEMIRNASPEDHETMVKKFWELAEGAKAQTQSFIKSGGPVHATRVFDFAMTISDMNNLIHLTAQSKTTKGRAYSAGIVNTGIYENQQTVQRENRFVNSRKLETKHGAFNIEQVLFATSHARTGSLYQASCMTLNGELQCTFHPAKPIVSEETNEKFADAFVDLLNIVAGMQETKSSSPGLARHSPSKAMIPSNALTYVAAMYGLTGVVVHWSAWNSFFSSLMHMKEAVSNPADFWAALNFWIFFAVGHPLLQPILWISEVMHGTLGPKIGDLIPVCFLLANAIAIVILSMSKEIRNALNVFALSSVLIYVGSGLDGQGGMGDFNLALDDSYKGHTVRGCPSYEEVRQPSMDNFEISRYQGLWYEQKFHDWTQFKEVYDTTLDIKLTDSGRGWIDDFGVKGPSSDYAPLSWDKSPVANGAHYFLFGRVDNKDPPGVLRESGFGVEFPNYIVDVQKDPKTGEYTEAIQFQCLERGGVRVFEGINFMSRKPDMSEEQLAAMHTRAEKAGMYPYGADPTQMHRVVRRSAEAPSIDNSWQAMWRAIGFDKLLELLTESIEDGGR